MVDGNLGRLARWLRFLGYPTAPVRGGNDAQMLECLAKTKPGLFLTRDRDLARRAKQAGHPTLLLNAARLPGQFMRLRKQLSFVPAHVLSLCALCNVPLEPAPAPAPVHVPAALAASARYCPACGRYYWMGSQAQRIVRGLRTYLRGRVPQGTRGD